MTYEPLKTETETVYKVDYYELDRFVKDVYNIPSFEGTLESPNDTTHEFPVSNEPLDSWSKESVEEAIEKGSCEYYILGDILDDLCNKGLIPSGTYLVRVSW